MFYKWPDVAAGSQHKSASFAQCEPRALFRLNECIWGGLGPVDSKHMPLLSECVLGRVRVDAEPGFIFVLIW